MLFTPKERYVWWLLIALAVSDTHCLNTRNETVTTLLYECIEICKKIERDCYFDCGRNTNVKSMILDRLWETCTDDCDKRFLACKGQILNNIKIKGCRKRVL